MAEPSVSFASGRDLLRALVGELTDIVPLTPTARGGKRQGSADSPLRRTLPAPLRQDI